MHNSDSEDLYNKGGLFALLFSFGFCLVFFVYISYVHPGVDLKEIPEDGVSAPALAGGAGSVDLSAIENPWEPSPELVAHGAKVYANNCALCHGKEGRGDGPGSGTNPPPRNFVEGNWTKGGGRVDLYKTVQSGIPGTSMAPFTHVPVIDRWAVVHFIRSITENLVADESAQVEEFAKTAK